MSAAESPSCRVCEVDLDAPGLVAHDRQYGLGPQCRIVECGTCGVAWTLPFANDADLPGFYPSETYSAYHQPGGLLGRLAFAPMNWWRFRGTPFGEPSARPPGRLLDVGCGRGDLLASFAERGWEAQGCDLSETAVAVCRERGLAVRHGALPEVAPALPSGAFDVVVYRHALEHVNDPVRDLEHACGLLAPGGTVLITLPNWDCWQRRLFRGRWFPLELPRHRIHLSAASLAAVAARAGLALRWKRTTTSALGLPWSLQYVVAGRLLTRGGWRLAAGYLTAVLLYPLTWLAGRIGGSGDFLHVSLARAEPGLPQQAQVA